MNRVARICVVINAIAIVLTRPGVTFGAQESMPNARVADGWDQERRARAEGQLDLLWDANRQAAVQLALGQTEVESLTAEALHAKGIAEPASGLPALYAALAQAQSVTSRADARLAAPDHWLMQAAPLAVGTGKRHADVFLALLKADHLDDAVEFACATELTSLDMFHVSMLPISRLDDERVKALAEIVVANDVALAHRMADKLAQSNPQFNRAEYMGGATRMGWSWHAIAGHEQEAHAALRGQEPPSWKELAFAAIAAPRERPERARKFLMQLEAELRRGMVESTQTGRKWDKANAEQAAPIGLAQLAYFKALVLGPSASKEVHDLLRQAEDALPAALRHGRYGVWEYDSWSSKTYVLRIHQSLEAGELDHAVEILGLMGTTQMAADMKGRITEVARIDRDIAEKSIYLWLLQHRGADAATTFLDPEQMLWPSWSFEVLCDAAEAAACNGTHEQSEFMLAQAARSIQAEGPMQFRDVDHQKRSAEFELKRQRQLAEFGVRAGLDAAFIRRHVGEATPEQTAVAAAIGAARRHDWVGFVDGVRSLTDEQRLEVFWALVQDGLWRSNK